MLEISLCGGVNFAESSFCGGVSGSGALGLGTFSGVLGVVVVKHHRTSDKVSEYTTFFASEQGIEHWKHALGPAEFGDVVSDMNHGAVLSMVISP